MTRAILAAAALAGGLVGFSSAQQPAPGNPDVAALAAGNNHFALDLYGQLRKDDGNLFFSPYSISNALAMTYAGARGQTADDMARTLKFPFASDRLNPALSVMVQDLNRRNPQHKYRLSVANGLWGQKRYGFLPEFVKLSKDAYRPGL